MVTDTKHKYFNMGDNSGSLRAREMLHRATSLLDQPMAVSYYLVHDTLKKDLDLESLCPGALQKTSQALQMMPNIRTRKRARDQQTHAVDVYTTEERTRVKSCKCSHAALFLEFI